MNFYVIYFNWLWYFFFIFTAKSAIPAHPKTKISAYEPNVETISLYKPDLVILSFNIRNLKEALSKLGIETIYLPAPNNFEQILDQIDLLGKRTGNTKKAQKLILNMQNKTKKLKKSTKSIIV